MLVGIQSDRVHCPRLLSQRPHHFRRGREAQRFHSITDSVTAGKVGARWNSIPEAIL